MTRLTAALLILSWLNGCAFVGMTAAGFLGTVMGNITSDKIEGKICPPK